MTNVISFNRKGQIFIFSIFPIHRAHITLMLYNLTLLCCDSGKHEGKKEGHEIAYPNTLTHRPKMKSEEDGKSVGFLFGQLFD